MNSKFKKPNLLGTNLLEKPVFIGYTCIMRSQIILAIGLSLICWHSLDAITVEVTRKGRNLVQ